MLLPDAAARGRRALRARVPASARVAERGLPANGSAARTARRAGRVLRLRPGELGAHPPLPQGLARALRGWGPAADRRALARLLVRARPVGGGARREAARDR